MPRQLTPEETATTVATKGSPKRSIETDAVANLDVGKGTALEDAHAPTGKPCPMQNRLRGFAYRRGWKLSTTHVGDELHVVRTA
tara:strand:- start:1583 stop:1834 length:252 start_codon:yes stop_codon:yes gene_type:complete